MRRLAVNFILHQTSLSGGVKSNRLIAEALARRGHDVTIAFVDRPQPWPGLTQPRRWMRRIVREVRARGKQRHHLERSTVHLISCNHLPITPEDIPDADVSIATWWETAEWIHDWPAKKGIKAYFIRGYEVHGGDPQRVRATYRLPYLKFVIATWLQRLMHDEFGDPAAVLVPNGVDWSQFDSQPREKPARPTVGMLYGHLPLKGASTAFEALRMVQQEVADLEVIAYGSRDIASSFRPPAGIEFHLRPAQSLIPKLYQRCTCWLVSSTREGFGMPGLEAAASHCPIVSTRCGGPEDYVEHGVNGYLVDVGDAAAMTQRIRDVIDLSSDRWRDMSAASYRIARGFDWDRSAAILERAMIGAVESREKATAGTFVP